MLKCVRFALVATATLSMVLLAGPASAGMVASPKAAAESADQLSGKELLKSRLVDAGASGDVVDRLSDDHAVTVLAQSESLRHAGGTGIAIAIGVAVIFALTIVILETYYPD